MLARLLRAILIGMLVLLVRFPVAASDERIEHDFSERLSLIAVENLYGVTEAQTWASASVRVVASRRIGKVRDSELSFERPGAGHLRIAVKHDDPSDPVALTLYLPASMHLSVRSISGSVTLSGTLAGSSIETESGPITLKLKDDSNSDLSLRTLEGAIDSRLPISAFGHTDAHVLDGRIGVGGATVIARSSRGNISILPFDAARTVTATLPPSGPNVKTPGVKGGRAFNSGASSGDDNRTGEFIKLEARLVTLNVKVTDASGKTLPALRKEDFVIYEDEVRQDLSYFEPVTAPLSVLLLLDLSGSTEKKMKIMKKAAQKFVDSLKESDRIAVAGFTRRFSVISNFTTDHKQLKERIGDIKNRHGGTAYYDSMWAALDLLDEAKAARKAIVVLTDGVDNSLDHPDDSEYEPKHPFDELLARMEEADATIYPIYFDTEYETIGRNGRNGHAAYVTARKQIERVAETTGAVMFRAERAEDLEGVYQQVAAELHSLYSMAYTPKVVRKDGKWRKVSIVVNLSGAKVRTKRGYFAK